jgi:hypothetical protein
MPTYRIIGADGKEYGPLSTDQMRQYLREGRVNMQTRVLVEGTTDWKTVADLPEFASTATPPGVATPPPAPPATGFPTLPTIPVYGSPADQVNGPGIALIILGALNIVGGIGRAATAIFAGATMGMLGNSADDPAKTFMAAAGALSVAHAAMLFLGGLLILFGGIKMRSLQAYGLCMTASIVAMIPCLFPCCIVGLPIGIWAIVVLSKQEVKTLFT